ncbi:MAG: NERD domain-containing protein [Gammaproteobacteria bacterium]|nr:NERD domain-containing protein [Gammaproteobacteria bacterium]
MSLKGWLGEKKTTFNMWLSLNKEVYRRFHNLIIPAKNGTTQIDHLLVSPYGLFIVETKNKKGWIFGSEDQPKWTQSIYGKKYSFQNPLRQTYRQKKVLSEYLGIDESKIRAVVFFVGDCKFKTRLPENVIKSGLGRYIKQFKTTIIDALEIDTITVRLQRHALESTLSNKDHVQSLRERHNSTTVCPKCGSNLVERTARKGSNAGSKFLGCENYPKCRFTKNA